MIAVDIQPCSVTSDIGFQRLLRKISPNYNIPSRTYFTDTSRYKCISEGKNKTSNIP
jgi:hypothetical protein